MSIGSMPASDLKPYYEAIWNEWLDGKDLEAEIQAHRLRRRRFHDLIRACVRRVASPHPALLEIGSGTAIDSYILAETLAVTLVGLDISLPSLQVAQRIGHHFPQPIALLAGDAERLCFADATFDLVYSQGVVEHFPDPRAMLSEQLRVLRPAGFLVINVPQRHTGYTAYKHQEIAAGTWPWGWETEYSYSDLRKLGRQYGLLPAAVIGYDYWPTRRGWSFWRNLHSILQYRNPWHSRALCQDAERLYEQLWTKFERTFGHYFMVNITVAFQRAGYARRL